MTVEVAIAADQAQVIALWHRCGLTRPWNDAEQDYDFALQGPASTVLVLRDAGVVVAACLCGHDGHRGSAYYVGVEPERRGQDLGRRLMGGVEDWLCGQGVWKINLMVRRGNEAAGFYERLGYADQDCVAFGKRLDGRSDRATDADRA